MKYKKKLKTILRRILWIFAGIILVILIFHTPPLRNIVKGLLSRTMANRVDGEIDIGRMHYHLWRGEVDLEDIKLDWAYVLDPQPEEKRYQIYFTIGHAF